MSELAIQPLDARILIQPIQAEQTTASGLVIPDSAQERSQEAIVLAVGSGVLLNDGTRVPLEVKAGDRIIFSGFGQSLKHDGEEYLLLSAGEVWAIVKD